MDPEDFPGFDDPAVELRDIDQSLASDSEVVIEDETGTEASQETDEAEFDQELMDIFIEELGQHARELRNIAGQLESELEEND